MDEEKRVVEAYVGEYASGKSELAINRALELMTMQRQVTLVDLDIVEPFYTLRPIKDLLEREGLNIIAYSRSDSFGLGETGAMLNPKAKWALRIEGDIIFDVGYGVHGAKTLNLVEGAEEAGVKVIAVINYMRPMTNSIERIKGYIKELGTVNAIVANTHLGTETTLDIIIKGNLEIFEAAKQIEIPIAYIAMEEKFQEFINKEEFFVPVKFIKRYMPAAIW